MRPSIETLESRDVPITLHWHPPQAYNPVPQALAMHTIAEAGSNHVNPPAPAGYASITTKDLLSSQLGIGIPLEQLVATLNQTGTVLASWTVIGVVPHGLPDYVFTLDALEDD